MPTAQQIINWVDRFFPNIETSANKLSDLNDIHKALYIKLQRLGNTITLDATQTTTSGTLSYTKPTNCTFDNIVSIKVSQTTGTPDANTVWDTFKYAGENDDVSIGSYYSKDVTDDTKIALTMDGSPISTTGLVIRNRYYARPADISSFSDTPDLDEDYHDLLKFKLAQRLAISGSNPDIDVANGWQAEYDEYLRDVMISIGDRDMKAPSEINQSEEYW